MVKRPTCSEPITLETCKSEPAEDVQGCSSEMLPFAASCEPICVADVLKQHAVLADAAMLKRGVDLRLIPREHSCIFNFLEISMRYRRMKPLKGKGKDGKSKTQFGKGGKKI